MSSLIASLVLRFIGALAVVAFAATAAGAAPDLAALQIQAYTAPKPAPAFTLHGLDGSTERLEALRGKVVLLFFWATW